jgi:nucleotide-binding universal stress UspA family protein
MAEYGKIVAAVDLSDESTLVIEKAAQVASDQSEIHLVFVQEPMDSVYLGVVPYGPVFVGMEEVEDKLKNELESRMRTLGE